MIAIPTINTPRLTLRAMSAHDFEDYAAMWQEPQTVAHLGGVPLSRAEAWTAFLRNAGHWRMAGFGLWAVEPRGTRRLMGQVGFFYGMRALGEEFDSLPEASWILHPEVQGQGLGLEAAQVAHDWFDRVITGPTACKMEPGHPRSTKVAEALGYRALRETRHGDRPARLMLRKHTLAPDSEVLSRLMASEMVD